MSTFPVKATMPYPHFPFFIFFGGGLKILFCTPCHTGKVQICNPTLDTMSWLQGGGVLCPIVLTLDFQEWIPMPPVSLYFSDVRFTKWTYPSHSLADIWFNVQCMLHCLTYSFVLHPHSCNFKVRNFSTTQIWVYHHHIKFMMTRLSCETDGKGYKVSNYSPRWESKIKPNFCSFICWYKESKCHRKKSILIVKQ